MIIGAPFSIVRFSRISKTEANGIAGNIAL
jgi:hypothetical protein